MESDTADLGGTSEGRSQNFGGEFVLAEKDGRICTPIATIEYAVLVSNGMDTASLKRDVEWLTSRLGKTQDYL